MLLQCICVNLLSFLLFLHQDYEEEISVAQENKQQLQVMGERLARASQDNKAAEIQHKLSKVSERWQHLLDLIAARWVHKTLKNRWKVLFDTRDCAVSVKMEMTHSGKLQTNQILTVWHLSNGSNN